MGRAERTHAWYQQQDRASHLWTLELDSMDLN